MFCPYCKMAMRTVDDKLSIQVCRDSLNMDGTEEMWFCSARCCDFIDKSVLKSGVRKGAGSVVIMEEHDGP